MSEWILGCQETFCIFKSMQSVSWHIRIRSDKPLYSSYLILKHLHIILHYSKSSPLCQCHNRKLSPYFKIILNLLEIPIISLHPWSNAVRAQSSVRCSLCGAAVGLLSRFPEWEVNGRTIDPRAGGGGAVLEFKRVKQQGWQQKASPCLFTWRGYSPCCSGSSCTSTGPSGAITEGLIRAFSASLYVQEGLVTVFARRISHFSEVAGDVKTTNLNQI